MASSGNKAGNEATVAAASSQAAVSGGTTSSVQTEAMKQILGVIDKKLRNLEKKKVRRQGISRPLPLLLPLSRELRGWELGLIGASGGS